MMISLDYLKGAIQPIDDDCRDPFCDALVLSNPKERLNMFDLILDSHLIHDINQQPLDQDEVSYLHLAFKQKKEWCIKRLVQKGADIARIDNSYWKLLKKSTRKSVRDWYTNLVRDAFTDADKLVMDEDVFRYHMLPLLLKETYLLKLKHA